MPENVADVKLASSSAPFSQSLGSFFPDLGLLVGAQPGETRGDDFGKVDCLGGARIAGLELV
jgi:hypothetical protein